MSRVTATGMAVPPQRMPSRAIERHHHLAAGTLAQVHGVAERRIAGPGVAASDLAVEAAAPLLAGASPGLVLVATSTPDHITPATAPLVAHRLGLSCGASDVTNTCSGFLYALLLADAHVEATRQPALVIGANILSRRVDWQGPWATSSLFGDGAGAVMLEAGRGMLGRAMGSDGAGYARITVPAGGSRVPLTPERLAAREHLLRVEGGQAHVRHTAAMMADAARRALGDAGLEPADVDWFIPHQASRGLVRRVCDDLGVPDERTVVNLDRYGNTSAASIPIALHEAVQDGRIRAGDTVLMAVAAGGMTSAAAVMEWSR